MYRRFTVEDLIEAGHPRRAIKRMVGRALAEMSRAFDAAVVPEKNNPPRGRGVVVRTLRGQWIARRGRVITWLPWPG